MAPWVIPALKAVLPHVGTIVNAATPIFTQRRAKSRAAAGTTAPTDPAPADADVQQQIAELQAAAGQNAQHIKELAAQLQSTVQALEQAAEQAQSRLTRLTRWCMGASAVAAVALVLAALGWAGR